MASYQEKPCLQCCELHQAAPGEFTECISNTPFTHKHSGWHGTLTTGSTKIWPFIPHHWVNATLLLLTQPTSAQWSSIHFSAIVLQHNQRRPLNFCFYNLYSTWQTVQMIWCNLIEVLFFFQHMKKLIQLSSWKQDLPKSNNYGELLASFCLLEQHKVQKWKVEGASCLAELWLCIIYSTCTVSSQQ